MLKLKSFLPSIYSQLNLEDRSSWQDFASGNTTKLPSHVEQRLTQFQRLLVFQALKPEALNSAMTNFVTKTLQIDSINPPSNDLFELTQNASFSPKQPVLFILGQGADPTQEIKDTASRVFSDKLDMLHILAIGNRRQKEALELLRNCMESGSWLYLTNMHLVPSLLLKIHGVGTLIFKS